jgi:hypothetical protein
MRLEDGEDDVLLARARKVLQAHLLRHFHQLRNGLELQLRQVHRLARSGQFGRRNNAYVIGIEIVLRQLVVLLLAVIAAAIAVVVAAIGPAITIAAAATTAAFVARPVPGLITEIASHSLLSRNAARSDLRRAPTF